jgi:hypothetical protein
MNSDFMQIEAEELAKRVALEPDNRSRVRKLYQYVFGRDATEEEVKLGLDYLKTEPLLEYDERKAKAAATPAGGRGGRRGGATPEVPAPMPVAAGEAVAADSAPMPDAMGMGMMGGMGRRGGAAGPPEIKYDATVWGRYSKVLFSSSEFLFIN